jgi:hypothetical protein
LGSRGFPIFSEWSMHACTSAGGLWLASRPQVRQRHVECG